MPIRNTITAWLRLRDRQRFSRDAQSAARDIREIGDAADDANRQTGRWNDALDYLQGLFTGSSSIGGRTRIFGFAIGTVATAAVAAIPIIVGLGGAVVALAGSLGQAVIGAGLLAGSLTVVLGAGLGAVGIVVANAISQFQQVNERFTTWRNAVAAFGANSDQARTALQRLNGVVQENGGPLILRAVMAWKELRDEFSKKLQPVTFKLFQGMTRLFGAVRTLLPTFARFTSVVVDALGPVLDSWLQFFTSAEFKASIGAIGASFAEIIGPIGQGMLSIFQGLLRLTVRMLPFLTPVAEGFQAIGDAFLHWATVGDLEPFLDSLKSWFDLLKATGSLLVTILTGGASAGDSLVQSLTDTIKKWDEFLSTAEGRDSMRSFFSDAIEMTKAFAGFLGWITAALFGFGKAALPAYTKFFNGARDVWNDFMDALAPAKPFWDNVLKPFLTGLVKGVGGSLKGAFKFIIVLVKLFATVLGFLGEKLAPLKGVFQILGQVIGFLFGGPILKLLGGLGKINVLLGPLGFAFRLLYKPIALVGRIVGFLFGRVVALGGYFARLAGVFIPALRKAWGRVLGFLAGLGPRFFDLGVKLWSMMKDGLMQAIGAGLGLATDIGKAVANAVIDTLNWGINQVHISLPLVGDVDPFPNDPIPKLAMGGVVSGSGSWITGEAGPELNTLRGGRVTVQPLPAISAPGAGSVSIDSGGGKRILVSKVYLRGKQIAEAVADEVEDEVARQ